MAALRRVPSFTNFNPQGLKVLLVEGDKKARQAADAQLKQCSYTVTGSSSCLEALALLGSTGTSPGFDVLLVASSALQAKAQDATKLMKQVKQLHVPFILMAECSSKPDEVMLGIKLGADDILEKPLCPLKLKNIWQHTVRRMMRSSSSKDVDMMMLDHAGHNVSCSGESGSPCRNNAAAAATACHLLIDSPPTVDSPVHPSSWGADPATAASSPVLGLVHSNAASTFGSPARSGDAAAAQQQGSDSSAERRSTKRKSKEYSSAPRCSSAAANNNNGSSSSPHATDVATGIIPPSTPAPSPSTAGMMSPPTAAASPAFSMPTQWPVPAPPTANLPEGMALGMPMNPSAVAPGITPPIFPPPPAPGILSPMQAAAAAAGWPMPAGMMPPPLPMCGIMPYGLGMPQFPTMYGMPSMCGSLGMAQSLPSQLPALPMHMLMDACASGGASNCGMGVPAACGMMGGCGSMQAACGMVDCMLSPCSPCSDPSSQDAAFSGKSAQDVLALDDDDIGYIQTLHIQTPSNTTGMAKMMPRCESNQLLPSLEDLIADQPTTNHSNATSACNNSSTPATGSGSGGTTHHHHHTSSGATAMLDPMDLELEALSLGCLGLKRNDSFEDILSRTIEVF